MLLLYRCSKHPLDREVLPDDGMTRCRMDCVDVQAPWLGCYMDSFNVRASYVLDDLLPKAQTSKEQKETIEMLLEDRYTMAYISRIQQVFPCFAYDLHFSSGLFFSHQRKRRKTHIVVPRAVPHGRPPAKRRSSVGPSTARSGRAVERFQGPTLDS